MYMKVLDWYIHIYKPSKVVMVSQIFQSPNILNTIRHVSYTKGRGGV